MTPTTEHECTNTEKLESKPWKGGCYAHYLKTVYEERTDAAIEHFQNWIAADLKELDGDTESDYAKFILQGHKHIRTVLIYLKNEKDFRLFREKEKDALCRERDDLRAELERVTAERDSAVADLYEACKGSPCNNGICVKKNCTGNIIPCEFEWRGEQKGE